MSNPARLLTMLSLVVCAAATCWAGASTFAGAALLHTALVLLIVREAPPRRAVAAPVVIVAGAAWLLVVAALMTTPALGPALQLAGRFGVGLGLIGAFAASGAPTLRQLWWSMTAAAVVHSVWAALQFWSTGTSRAAGGFAQALDLGSFLAPLLVFAALEALRAGPERRLWIGAAVLIGLGVLHSGSRAAIGAVLVGLILAAPVAKRLSGGLRWAGVAAVGLVGVAVLTWRFRSSDVFASSRLDIFAASLDLAMGHPLGVGLGAFADAMRVHGVPLAGLVRYPKLAGTAHNELLHLFAELGWPGLALASGIIVLALDALRRVWRADPAAGRRLAALGASLVVPSLFHTSFHLPPVGMLVALWFAEVLERAGYVSAAAAAGHAGRTYTLGRWPSVALACLGLLFTVPGTVGRAAGLLAASQRQRGDLEAALASAEVARAVAPFSAGAVLLLESIAVQAGAPPLAASERLAAAAEKITGSLELVERAAWLAERHAEKDGSAASRALVVALRQLASERDPHNVDSWVALAEAQRVAGDSAGRTTSLRRAVTEEPHAANPHALLALALVAAGDVEAARPHALAARTSAAVAPRHRDKSLAVLSLAPELSKMLAEVGL